MLLVSTERRAEWNPDLSGARAVLADQSTTGDGGSKLRALRRIAVNRVEPARFDVRTVSLLNRCPVLRARTGNPDHIGWQWSSNPTQTLKYSTVFAELTGTKQGVAFSWHA